MKQFIAMILIVACTFSSASIAWAEPLPPIPDVVLVPLKKSAPAPFSGVLLPPEAVATLVAELEQFDSRLKVEIDKVQRDFDAKIDFNQKQSITKSDADKAILQAEIERQKKLNDMLLKDNDRIKKSQKNTKAWTIVGFVAGIVVAGAAVYGYEKIAN